MEFKGYIIIVTQIKLVKNSCFFTETLKNNNKNDEE